MRKISKHARKQILNTLFLLLLIGITLGVLLASNSELNFENVWDFVKGSNPWLLVAAFFCMVAGIVCEGLSLHLISHKLGHKGRVISSIAYSSADIYYSAITPSASGGQPASAYYMIKDGMGAGTASFTLVFNVVAYSAAFLVLAATAFLFRPTIFADFGFWVQFFIILGIVVQALLMGFFIACMYWHSAVLKLGNGVITLLAKIKIVKKVDKWRAKLADEVEKYRNCTQELKKHRLMFFGALLLNVAQRYVRVLISCFVCLAADPSLSFATIFALQAFLIVGYTSLPLPGGVGAFEYLYLNIYEVVFTSEAFLLSAMMVTRVISYYLSIVVSGAMTLSYHVSIMRRKPAQPELLPREGGDGDGENPKERVEDSDMGQASEDDSAGDVSEDGVIDNGGAAENNSVSAKDGAPESGATEDISGEIT